MTFCSQLLGAAFRLTASRIRSPGLSIEFEGWSKACSNPVGGESAERRIDAALQELQRTATRIAASLEAFDAKLDSAVEKVFAAPDRDLRKRLENAETWARERAQIEPILTQIIDRLERLPGAGAEGEIGALRSVDHELKSLREAIEASAAHTLDRLTERLESAFAAQASDGAVSAQLAELNGRFDVFTNRLVEVSALERAARDLMERLQDKDPGSRRGENREEVSERPFAFQHERKEAERRTELLLRGIRDDLDRLIDRLPGDGSGRSGAAFPDRESDGRDIAAHLNPEELGDLSGFAPRSSQAGRGQAAGGENAAPREERDDEFLLEPGAGAPEHLRVAAGLAQAIGPRTNPAVSVHIAAARRAAQAALADNAQLSNGWPRVEQNVQNAKRFYTQHRRSLLLVAVLVLTLTAVARIMGAHAPLLQKSELSAPVTKPPAALALPNSPSRALAAFDAAAAVDAIPTGSIAPNSARSGGSAINPTPPDLTASIPSDAPASLRDGVLGGSALAQYDLAQRLLEGRGLSQDQANAAFWFGRAATAGFAPAQFRLGALYQKGVGVGRDPAMAKRWYSAAARLGNARAAHNLGVMDAEPDGEKADYAEAAKWFRRAAEMGVRDSQFNLAVLYARGLGVDQDLRQSWKWFSLAAGQGDLEAAHKRDEIAKKMDPDALTAAADQLAKFRAVDPDPAANDAAATPPASSSRRDGPGS